MKKSSESTTPPAWADIEAQVMGDLDLSIPCVRFAADHWNEHVDSVRNADPALEVAHQFSSPRVFDAAVAYLRADVAENEAIFRLRVARNLKLLRFLELRVALGEEDGVFIDEEEGARIVPELLAVVRVDESAKTAMVKKVIASARAMAESNGSPDPTALSWPPLGEGIMRFAQDLARFIHDEGDDARDIVTRVCDDGRFARSILEEGDSPKPLLFLAELVVQANGATKTEKAERKIGFGVDG